MKKFLAIALFALMAVATINVAAPNYIVGTAWAAPKFIVRLVRPDGTVSATNTYNNYQARDAKAKEWQDAIDDGLLPAGYHVERTDDYTNDDGPLDPNQN